MNRWGREGGWGGGGGEEGQGTARDKSKVSGGSDPHAFGQGAIYEDMEELLGLSMTARAQTTGL